MKWIHEETDYDVDQGVAPDHAIDDYAHFYDRDALTEFIHGLF